MTQDEQLEAIMAADKDFQAADYLETLRDLDVRDARDMVFFNMLRSIAEKVNPTFDDAYYQRIQSLVFHATFEKI